MRTLPIALVAALACSSTAQRGDAQPIAHPGTAVPSGSATSPAPAPTTKDQPPYIKLKLGHYSNKQLGIGVVIDLSEVIDNVAVPPPGKIRFDGEPKVWRLKGRRGERERVDYSNDQGHLMLQSYTDGRRSVFVLDPTNDKWSDEIAVQRDGDADPL
jgi:hypothetical protein